MVALKRLVYHYKTPGRKDDPQDLCNFEAGGAAMMFFFGLQKDIHSIWIKSSESCTNLRTVYGMDLWTKEGVIPENLANRARKEVMINLAQKAAQFALDELRNGSTWDDWYGTLRANSDLCDLFQIYLPRLYGDDQRVRQELLTLAKWTQEIITQPRMWLVVQAMAKALYDEGYRRSEMRSERAWEVMASAFYNSSPIEDLGGEWLKRFPMK